MITSIFVPLVLLGSFVAGLLGSLTGLGGGVVIVPLLVLVFHVNVKYAIGASLVSVIATSSGAAAAYVREGYSNIRMGMFLEIATTLGALFGASLATRLPAGILAMVFGAVLIVSAGLSLQHVDPVSTGDPPGHLETLLKLDSAYPTPEGPEEYHVRHIPGGICDDVWGRHALGLAGNRVPGRSRCWPWTRSCACRSKCPPPPATS